MFLKFVKYGWAASRSGCAAVVPGGPPPRHTVINENKEGRGTVSEEAAGKEDGRPGMQKGLPSPGLSGQHYRAVTGRGGCRQQMVVEGLGGPPALFGHIPTGLSAS